MDRSIDTDPTSTLAPPLPGSGVRLTEALPRRRNLREREALRLRRRLAAIMAATDAGSAVVAFVLAELARRGSLHITHRLVLALLIAPAVWILVFSRFRLYGVMRLPPAEEFRRLLAATTTGMAVLVVATFLVGGDLPRRLLVFAWIFSVVLIVVSRRLWHRWMGRARGEARMALRTVIVGSNEEARQIARTLQHGMEFHGFNPVGFVSPTNGLPSLEGLPAMGKLPDLPTIIRGYDIECVYLASTALTEEEAKLVTQAVSHEGIEVRVSANLYDILSSRLSVQPVGNLLALSLRPVRLTGAQIAMKRTFDVAAALALGILAAPAWLAIAAAVKLDSRGPVLFRQERVTKGGRIFTMYKFRTMVRDGARIARENGIDPSMLYFKLPDDPRITRVGRFLRRYSLDELPQLWNVIRGDMSLVGPRPLAADQVAGNIEFLAPRHQVPTGMTGWWQVNGRSSVSPEEALHMDLFYLENWSPALDLYILLKTVGATLARRGAY